MNDVGLVQAGAVAVHTTSGRGSTPEEIAARCVGRLLYVADSAPPEIRAQAHAFQSAITSVVAQYIREAAASDRTRVCAALRDAGKPELAEVVRRL